MSVDLIGVTAMGGLPLFVRQSTPTATTSAANGCSGDRELSFASMAALNGVNLFSRLNDSDLMYCSTKDTQIRWKVFKGCVVLIVIVHDVPHITPNHLLMLLDIIFDSLVLICGLNEIMSQNIERLKRCLRHSFPLIDYLLNCFISNPMNRIPFITNTIEYSMGAQSCQQLMQSVVESGGQLSSSSFCWLFINKKLVSGSNGFWSRLHTTRDAVLITNLVNSMSDTDLIQTKEIAVYLPDNCPTIVSRLVVCQVSKGVVLCLLCAEEPTIDFIDTEIIVPLIDSKIHFEKFCKYLRNEIQTSLPIDSNIMSFIIFRKDLKIYSTFGHLDHKLDPLVQSIDWQNNDKYESYSVNESHKCYHISNELSIIFLSFRFNTTLNQMHLISHKTLTILLKDKHIWPQI